MSAREQVWGMTLHHGAAARAVGERAQVRAIVRAPSRAAAARALHAAGLFQSAGVADRGLRTWGTTTWNPVELEVASVPGEVFVAQTIAKPGPRMYLPWPQV